MRGKSLQVSIRAGQMASFNEARALCAGSRNTQRTASGKTMVASMRPAHYAREVSYEIDSGKSEGDASMRPAHYAREVRPSVQRAINAGNRFNEARALCAGSRRYNRY